MARARMVIRAMAPALRGTAQAQGLAFPAPSAAIDLDFVNRRYWWNGALRAESEFTTFALNGSTFDAVKGLNIATGIDVTLALAGLGTFVPGACACAVYHAAAPASTKGYFALDDGTNLQRAGIVQVTTAALQLNVVNSTVQGNVTGGVTTALNTRHGYAASYDLNDFKAAGNGSGGTPDTVGTLPATATTLRIGKNFVAGSEALGALSRLVLYPATKTQAELNALSTQMQLGPPAPSLPTFPYPDAALGVDCDFVNRRYYWGGLTRTEANFTTFALGSSTIGANGLVCTDTCNITLLLSTAVGTYIPGAFAAAVVHSAVPASTKRYMELDDATANETVALMQSTAADLVVQVLDGGVSQANITPGGGTALATKHGFAASFQTNDVKASTNGTAGTQDTSCTMPSPTLLRIGKGTGANAASGALSRCVWFTAVKTQAELNALAIAMRDNS